MCKTAFSILIERTTKYVVGQNGYLKIRFEGAGKKEDRAIMQYAKDLKSIGMPFDLIKSTKYCSLQAQDFKKNILGEPERQTKKSPLLQIADIYLYPMVKGGYKKEYAPYQMLLKEKKLIDAIVDAGEIDIRGIKYSYFDDKK